MSTSGNDLPSKPVQPRPAALYLGALFAAVVENALHPLDTASKRLQDNKQKIPFSQEGIRIAYRVVTNGSLFAGISTAIASRLVQRSFMYGTQPIVSKWINKEFSKEIETTISVKYKSVIIQAASAGAMGIMETAFLPLDTAKVLKQLKDERSLSTILFEENLKLYRATAVTALRNLSATVSLFGFSELMKVFFWKIQPGEEITFTQNLSSSFVASMIAIAASTPADVIKTRVQKSTKKTTALTESKDLIKESGLKGFTKGIYPRFFCAAPRIAVIKTVAEYVAPHIEELMRKFEPLP